MTILEKLTVADELQEPRPVQLTVENFLHLSDTGAFREYAKTELIGGTIVAMNAQFSRHARIKTHLLRRLADAVDEGLAGYDTWAEVSVAISPVDLPEPDLVLTSFQASERAAVPVETVALIVEIADTTARYDLDIKADLYAAAGVPEYWVVEIPTNSVHQFWEPTKDGYAQRRNQALGQRLEAITLPFAIDLPE